MTNKSFSISLAGDIIITRSWSDNKNKDFLDLVKILRESDVSIGNLETLIHSFKGYPENNNQGPHMATNPEITSDLSWAGFNLLAGASNHSNDYGAIGTIENIENVNKAGLQIAGVGGNLFEARSPVYYSSKMKVALIAATSTFDSWAKASNSIGTFKGRPGINPITLTASYSLFYKFAKSVYQALMKRGIILKFPKKKNLKIGNSSVSIGKEIGGTFKANLNDLAVNLDLIKESRKEADIVIFSIHSHEGTQSGLPGCLHKFSRDCIDKGADLVFSHGPHYVKGIEIYKGCPIFHGLGNFVFESETIKKIPSAYYDIWNLDYSLSAEEVFKITDKEFNQVRKYWESILPVVKLKNNKITEILIYPVSLGYGGKFGHKGTPYLANVKDGKRIIKKLKDLSIPFNTEIEYLDSENIGRIQLI